MYCDPYYENCVHHHGLWYWVAGSLGLSIAVNVIIVVVALIAMWVILTFVRRQRLPLCYYCEQEGEKTHTDGVDEQGRPECDWHAYDHDLDRRMAAEVKRECPDHHVTMTKEVVEGADEDVIVDVCPQGCVFLDPGELEKIQATDDDSSSTSTIALMTSSMASSTAVFALLVATSPH